MKLTLHAAMSLNEGSEIDQDQILILEPEIGDYVWSLLGDFQETYSPFAHRCQGAIYEYLYNIDPIGLRDDKVQKIMSTSSKHLQFFGCLKWIA